MLCYCSLCNGGKDLHPSTIWKHEKRDRELYQVPAVELPIVHFWPKPNEELKVHVNSDVSVISVLAEKFAEFADNSHGTKKVLDKEIRKYYSDLPVPNNFPPNYKCALTFVKPYLTPVQKIDSCIKDCVLFRKYSEERDYSNDVQCPSPNHPSDFPRDRYFGGRKKTARKRVFYIPLKPQLVKRYAERNVAKLLHAGQVSLDGVLRGIKDGAKYKSWFSKGGIFEGRSERNTFPLALAADGLTKSNQSMWIVETLLLPIDGPHRHVLGFGTLLSAVVPGYRGQEPETLEGIYEVSISHTFFTHMSHINMYQGKHHNIGDEGGTNTGRHLFFAFREGGHNFSTRH